MKPSDKIFFIAVLSMLYFCHTSHAIYDPRETHTVKPPRHREPGIPWYLSSATSAPPIDSQVSEWDQSVDSTPRNPVIVHDGAHSHRHDYQTSDGVIEQQSVTSFDNNYEQGQDTRENFDFQQYSDKNYAENGWFIDNDDGQRPYEDFASEIKKPYKDTKDFTTEPVESMKIAKYDSATGAHCPTSDATGQFVYPPDCKFFVNCWNGRAFVQPCAPGTLFNPETLECDFPIKVQCYGTELRDLTGTHNVPPPTKTQPLVTGTRNEWRVESPNNTPTCPPWITGLLPHPNDCTKFLQCANGGTFIMDCGPGTVFNPAISVCDWPYNVRGCEGALRPELEITTGPMRENFDVRGNFREETSQLPVQSNTVTCLEGQEGLFRHPSDCTKFLQCNHGNTYVMDCGPGTVFNPSISSCDFPYNVAGCSEAQPTVTERSQSGTDSYNQNLWGQNTFVQSGQSETGHDRTTYPTNIPNVPIGQNFHNGRDHEHSNQNINQHSHGTNYPDTNWHQYPNNRNYGQPTGSSHHILPNGNWNTYHDQNNNNHHSEGSYSNVPGTTITQHTQFTSQNTYVDSNYRLPDEDESPNRRGDYGRELPITNPVWNYGQPSTTTENIIHQHRWNQPESNISQPGTFVPSTWRGQDKPGERPSNPAVERPWLRGNIDPGSQMTTDRELDSKLDQWAMKTNLFHQGGAKSGTKSVKQGKNFSVKSGTKKYNQNSTTVRNENLFPTGIYVNVNGIRGHFITKEIEINQGHSNTRQYGNENGVNTLGVPKNRPGLTTFYQNPVAQSTDTVTKQPNHQFIYRESDPKFVVPMSDNSYIITEKYDLPPVKTKNFRPNTQNNLQKIPLENEINHNLDQTHILCKNGQRNCILVNNPKNDEREYHRSDKNTSYIATEFGDDDNDRHKISNKTNVELTAQNSSILVEGGALEEDSKDVINDRKPKLIFENKTVEDSKTSTIMKINKEKIDLDLFGVDLIHDKEEPPFPVYYVPPVEPINYVPELAVQISPISGQMLRLRGGSVLGEGYLEVQGAEPGWGIVCDLRHEWTLKEANVVCRQLGYTRGADMAWQGRNNPGEILSWIAADSVRCVGNETYFQSCEFTYNSYCDVARDAVGIRCLPNRVAYCREDEIPHRGFCYHLANPDTALNHAEALGYCNNKESKLLDIIDQNENNFISEWLVQSHPDISSVMTSGFGFTTLGRTLWLWEDSQHAKFRFNKWWPGWMSDKRTPPSVGTRPACVVMKRNFPCHNRPDENCRSDYFFWDTEDCAASSRGHSYVCKRAYNDIGCVYGKGQHYSGTANVTASGTICLAWGDESVEQYLNFKVNSEEIRNKLKEHNYCRNPNPNREIKPWCFTGTNGEFDYCDIPPCAKQGTKKSIAAGQCKPKHFECTPGECIPSPWICDGEEDCTNGADEQACFQHLEIYTKIEQHRLEDYDVEKWLNTPLKTCALRCKEADFTCRSFSHKALGNICLLSDSNVGLTGSLQPSEEYDYYEMKERTLNCSDMFVCGNQKCINQSLVCNGKNNCGDRSDESICDLQNLGYEIRLSGSNNTGEGKVEVKAWGRWGQVCDDGFGMIAASVVCKELGFTFGAREIRPAAFYSKGGAATFLMDQVKCRGNETSLRECDFDGWGVHNCLPDEAVGIVCKTAVNTCQDGFWKCDNSPECIPTPFICDEVVDCGDGSDEGPEHCEAPFELRLSGGSSPLEGRVEVRHHGIWGTVCDDDFTKQTATVICKSLGYGGSATALKNGAFGPGEGPIWLDEVYCSGNETQLYKCDHEPWGRHNCGHDEDAGVRCEPGEVIVDEQPGESVPYLPEITVNDILPADCGMRVEDFDENDEYMARVVRGSIAPKGAYPWQASLRVKGHSRSSHWCGAVVISPRYVLTAAHCLEGYNKGMYFVRAGDFNTEIDDGTEVEANIEDYYIHEDFRRGQRMNNDIALVLLKGRGIPLGRNIMPICLPPENVEYLPGLNCTISGWGSIESGKSVQSNFLRFGWVPILDQSICRADYVYGEGAISDGMVCAGYLNEGVDSCDGDSGGPLACYHNNAFTLYGLTSWGKHCGAPNKPGVYVRLAYYRRWIDQKIQESSAGR